MTTLWLVEKTFFISQLKVIWETYDNIWKISNGEGNDCTTGCLLHFNYFNKYYKMITIDLSKQYVLDAAPKAKQQINYTGNLEEQSIMFWLLKKLIT